MHATAQGFAASFSSSRGSTRPNTSPASNLPRSRSPAPLHTLSLPQPPPLPSPPATARSGSPPRTLRTRASLSTTPARNGLQPPPRTTSSSSPRSLLLSVLTHPPLPLNQILAAGSKRFPDEPPQSVVLPVIPSAAGRKDYQLQDRTQQNDALWGSFQADLRHRLTHRNDPPPPPEAPKHKSMRGPKVVRPSPPPPPEPADWTGKVALALHQRMKKSQQRVADIFKKFDTDNSQSLDATEFMSALIELGIPEQLKIPDGEWGQTLQEVFETMDDDGNGVLSFKEINHYLRAGTSRPPTPRDRRTALRHACPPHTLSTRIAA